MRPIKVSFALAAFAAILVVPSIALATSPTLLETTEDGTTHLVSPGTTITATNIAHAGTQLTTVWKSSLGNLECETATWTGEVTKNSGGGIEIDITTVEFRGKPGNHNPACTGGFFGDITWTPNHTSDAIGSLPWCLKISAEDKFTIRGGKCNEAAKPLKFRLDTASFGPCTYENSLITGTYTTHPADAVLTFASQKFNKIEGSASCSSSFELFAAFTLTEDKADGTEGATSYIGEVVPPPTGPTLTAPTGTIAGGKIIATNVAHSGTVLTTILKTSLGNVECETATVTGELTKNGDGIEGNITTAEFKGKPNSSPHSERCSGGFGGDTLVTPSHTVDALGSLPWCVTATIGDKFTVHGGKCNEAAKALKFSLDTTTLGTCSYERSVATGPVTGTYTTHPADAVLTITGQKFKKTSGSAFCPSEGELFMAFTLTEDKADGTEGATAYIDEVVPGPTLTAPTGTVASGKIIATNVAHSGTALTTILKTSLGNVECETATVTGTLTRNDGTIIEGEVETAEFRGKPEDHSLHCKGGFGGNTTVTPSHTSALGLPWCVKAGGKDLFEIRGGKCSEAAAALKFSLHTATLGTCSYERSVATGPATGTYTTHPADAVLTITGQKFKKTSGSAFCPSEGELFMAFTLTEDKADGTEGATAYIDEAAS